ncbi:MAG TPA: hypothetical protein VGR21_10470, partial [Cryptosporangiaceae bacterium]|nr:hypothetical protein [Cryptosporangiaceae bacterium]
PTPVSSLGPPVVSRDGRWLAMLVDPDAADGLPQTALAVGTVSGGADDFEVIPGTAGVPGAEPVVAVPRCAHDGRVYLAAPGSGGRVLSHLPGEKAARPIPVPGLSRIDAIRVA